MAIIDPPPSHGGMAWRMSSFTYNTPMPVGPYELVPGEDVEIAVQGLNVNRMVHHRLGTINQHFRTGLMGFVDDQRHRIFRAQHV